MNPVTSPEHLTPEQKEALAKRLQNLSPDGTPDFNASQGTTQQFVQQATPPVKERSLKERIQELEESADGFSVDTSAVSESAQSFRDEMGDETFYVKNLAAGHLIISDLNMPKIDRGRSVDLLRHASLEDLKKSRDLRTLLASRGEKKLLQRLTPEQYYEEKRREVDDKKKIELLRLQETARAQQQPQHDQHKLPHERIMERKPISKPGAIRPVILSKLGKLALKNDPNPENFQKAMTTIEFMDWVMSENLSSSEIDYILGDPAVVGDHGLRASLLQKKAML